MALSDPSKLFTPKNKIGKRTHNDKLTTNIFSQKVFRRFIDIKRILKLLSIQSLCIHGGCSENAWWKVYVTNGMDAVIQEVTCSPLALYLIYS